MWYGKFQVTDFPTLALLIVEKNKNLIVFLFFTMLSKSIMGKTVTWNGPFVTHREIHTTFLLSGGVTQSFSEFCIFWVLSLTPQLS